MAWALAIVSGLAQTLLRTRKKWQHELRNVSYRLASSHHSPLKSPSIRHYAKFKSRRIRLCEQA